MKSIIIFITKSLKSNYKIQIKKRLLYFLPIYLFIISFIKYENVFKKQ